VAAASLVLLAGACGEAPATGALHARKVTLEREVEGLRRVVARLERGLPGLPPGDVTIAVEDRLLRDLLAAELPLEADVDRFHVRLERAQVAFRGSPLVTLEGRVALLERPDLEGELRVLGALDAIAIDRASGTLGARIAVDHIDLKRLAGLETVLSGATLDDVARDLRKRLAERLPALTIPVAVQQRIELPALSSGPVRTEAAAMPLEVTVSQVLAVGGTLWVSVHVEAGSFRKAGPGDGR
jgi:hypothetical protein